MADHSNLADILVLRILQAHVGNPMTKSCLILTAREKGLGDEDVERAVEQLTERGAVVTETTVRCTSMRIPTCEELDALVLNHIAAHQPVSPSDLVQALKSVPEQDVRRCMRYHLSSHRIQLNDHMKLCMAGTKLRVVTRDSKP